MSRHASLLDVLLPVVFVSARHDLVPRYVAKRELLWDPWVDLAGHRLATAFVRREGSAHDQDVAAVASLARDLGPRDALVIFPEGTRFTEAKRARVLASLARKDEAAFARASRLKNLLPPHPGGPLSVLERARGADVVFCAHTGLEGTNHLRDLLAGSLIGATVRVRYWRVAARDVPTDAEEQLEWLWQWWERLDAWIESHLPRGARAGQLQPTRVPMSQQISS
jgi:1-acyl-sn-glycerol-3-phosphate acyltransferase